MWKLADDVRTQKQIRQMLTFAQQKKETIWKLKKDEFNFSFKGHGEKADLSRALKAIMSLNEANLAFRPLKPNTIVK